MHKDADVPSTVIFANNTSIEDVLNDYGTSLTNTMQSLKISITESHWWLWGSESQKSVVPRKNEIQNKTCKMIPCVCVCVCVCVCIIAKLLPAEQS